MTSKKLIRVFDYSLIRLLISDVASFWFVKWCSFSAKGQETKSVYHNEKHCHASYPKKSRTPLERLNWPAFNITLIMWSRGTTIGHPHGGNRGIDYVSPLTRSLFFPLNTHLSIPHTHPCLLIYVTIQYKNRYSVSLFTDSSMSVQLVMNHTSCQDVQQTFMN